MGRLALVYVLSRLSRRTRDIPPLSCLGNRLGYLNTCIRQKTRLVHRTIEYRIFAYYLPPIRIDLVSLSLRLTNLAN
jgi:hypothetical protein